MQDTHVNERTGVNPLPHDTTRSQIHIFGIYKEYIPH